MEKFVSTFLFKMMACCFCIAQIPYLNASANSEEKAVPESYLNELQMELQKEWPDNRTMNIVFHGHSVPSGYGVSPQVNKLGAYPNQVFVGLVNHYPTAVLNVITTSIGGEHSEDGLSRFENEVLNHHPDVLFIDYALNDRMIGLKRAEQAWRKMIEIALDKGIKVILMTPTPDLSEDILSQDAPLQGYAEMIHKLAGEYHVGLVDSYQAFKDIASSGEKLDSYMAQFNHPNSKGHEIVAHEILKWFNVR